MHTGRILMQSMLWRGLYYVSAFIINILIARHFQASVSGGIYFIISIYSIAVLVSSLSLESGIIYFAAKKQIPLSKLFSFSIVWSLFIGAVILFVAFYFSDAVDTRLSRTFLIASSVSFICGNLLITYCSGFFYAANNFIIPNVIFIVSTCFLIIVIPYHGHSLIPGINDSNYFYVYMYSFLVQGVCLALFAKVKYIKTGGWYFLSINEFRLLFNYCFMAFAGNIIHLLLYRIDYFFVEKYCDPAQLGNYIQVSKLVNLFFILPTILASVVFPVTASGQKTDIIRLLTVLSRCIFTGYLFVCIVLAAVGKSFFPYLFGDSFSQMYNPFLLLIPGILALSGIFTITAYFAGKNRIRHNITGSLLALIVILAGDIIFIPRYGTNAAALVSSAGYLVYQVYVIIIINKEFNTKLSDFFVFRFSDVKKIKNYFFVKS
jgi:O-antigen/teichoic acid export membrane protein